MEYKKSDIFLHSGGNTKNYFPLTKIHNPNPNLLEMLVCPGFPPATLWSLCGTLTQWIKPSLIPAPQSFSARDAQLQLLQAQAGAKLGGEAERQWALHCDDGCFSRWQVLNTFSSCCCSCLSGFCLVTELSHFIRNFMERLPTYNANKQTNKQANKKWFGSQSVQVAWNVTVELLSLLSGSATVSFYWLSARRSEVDLWDERKEWETCRISPSTDMISEQLDWMYNSVMDFFFFFRWYLDWFKPCTHTEGIVGNSSATVWVQRRWVIFAVHALSRTALARLRRPSLLAFVKAIWAPCVNEVITQCHSRP